MTRKDFIVVAESLRLARPPREDEIATLAWHLVRAEITIAFDREYPNFHREKFIEWTNKGRETCVLR